MGYPDPATTDWVPLRGRGLAGATGPTGATGVKGLTGDPGSSGATRAGLWMWQSGDITAVGAGWTLINNWVKDQIHGDWGPWPQAVRTPYEGWYVLAATVYFPQQFAGGSNKQVQIEMNGTDSIASGSMVARGQRQGGDRPFDDFVNAECAIYCAAATVFRVFAWNGNASAEIINGGGYTTWGIARLS